MRPDAAFAIKELSSDLNAPTESSIRKLKHLMRYLKGTMRYKLLLQPSITLDPLAPHDATLTIPSDANWAGCPNTRKSTSGVLVEFLGVPIHFISRTQGVVA